MSGRAAGGRAPPLARGSVKAGARRACPLALAVLVLCACGSNKLLTTPQTFSIVGGEPAIDTTQPAVQESDGGAKPSDFGSSAPVQVDLFKQHESAKVDILWVVDNSTSMAAKQNRLKANFQGFIDQLTQANEAIDYHIGVVTTDTVSGDQSGKLQNRAGLSHPWVGEDTCGAGCDQVTAFQENASVGESGSGDEKPLLAAEMALTPPLSTVGQNAGFLRADATLFIIVLTDEDDHSCAPISGYVDGQPDPVVGTEACEPGQETWGSTEYFARLFSGLKGPSNSALVTFGAIVAPAPATPIHDDAGAGMGCVDPSDNSVSALYARRIVTVAQEMGMTNTVASICDSNYNESLSSMGFLATGAKTTFYLTRAPFQSEIQVYVTTPDGGTRTLEKGGADSSVDDYQYLPCSQGAPSSVENAIVFYSNKVPPTGSTIEVDYPVDVGGVQCPPP